MWDKILNLPCSTSPAVHRSLLDLQNLSMENNEQLTNEQEVDGEVNPIMFAHSINPLYLISQPFKCLLRQRLGEYVC